MTPPSTPSCSWDLSTICASARTDPTDWQVLIDAARAIERVPELLGLSPHLLCTARRPAQLIYG